MPATGAIRVSERLVRTAYWTFFTLTVIITSYGFMVELFGLGLFIHTAYNDSVPKLHMRGETTLAVVLSTVAAAGLFVASFLIHRQNRTLFGVGLTGCAYWFAYFAAPRF